MTDDCLFESDPTAIWRNQVPVAASRRCKSCGRCIHVLNTAFGYELPEVLCDGCVEMRLGAEFQAKKILPISQEIYNYGQSRRFLFGRAHI